MATNEMVAKVEELRQIENFIGELKAQAEAIKDSFKEEMNARDVEEMLVGQYVIRYTSIMTSRFDTKSFKLKMGEDVYKAFCKEVSSKRFSIA